MPTPEPARDSLLQDIALRVLARSRDPFTRVGIDGADGAGKTTFADELARILVAQDRHVVRASVDGFHNPRAIRYRQGRASPEGYFQDSYDYPAMRRALLDPFGPGGSGRYRMALFDHVADAPVDVPERVAAAGAIVIVDGIFLHRPELAGCWDISVFLDVAFAVSASRMATRDGSDPDPAASANRRYVEGQRLYLAACDPRSHATIVVDNNDVAAPRIVR